MSFEYVVVPAPRRAPKIKGAKTPEARFAHALTEVMNAYAAEGWDYLRSDTLPAEERSGLTGTKTVFQNMLVFRRYLGEPEYAMPEAEAVAAPDPVVGEPVRPAPVIEQPGEPESPAAMPHLGAHRGEAGAAPRLGPAEADDDRVTRFPVSGVERRD